MWLPTRVKEVGSVDIGPALEFLQTLSEDDWAASDAMKNKLAGDRPTQSVFFYSLTKEQLFETLSNRPLTQDDVPELDGFEKYYPGVEYLFKKIKGYYPKNGVFVRAQLARMRPGALIDPHRDSFFILENSHRIHIPIITTEKLQFMVDGERVKMSAGKIYELNNQVMHWVSNPKDSIDRVHLILDYMPPEYNIPESLDENFKFYIKKHRANRPVKNPISSLRMPRVLLALESKQVDDKFSNELVTFDLEKKTIQSHSFILDAVDGGGDSVTALTALRVYENNLIALAGDKLLFFDKNFKVVKSFSSPYLKNARDVYVDGRFLYFASTACDGVLRFNVRKQLFDSGWQLKVNPESGSVAMVEFAPNQQHTVEQSRDLGVNSVWLDDGCMIIGASKLDRLIHYKNGKCSVMEQIPKAVSCKQPFNKGVIYANESVGQITFSANFDYRQVDLPVEQAEQNASGTRDGVAASAQPGCLIRYAKGTVIYATGKKLYALDMKNQAIVCSFEVPVAFPVRISGLVLWDN